MKLDEAQTAAWNEWFEKGFQNHFSPHVESINRALASIHKEIDESATNADLDKVAAETNTALAKVAKDLEIKVIETRVNLSKEMREDGSKVLASILKDIELTRQRLWDDLIVKFSADMNIMIADTRALIRKNIEDEVREVVRKNIEDEVRAAVRKEMVERRHRFSRKPQPPNVTDIDTKQRKA